jgi:hypothetical protein
VRFLVTDAVLTRFPVFRIVIKSYLLRSALGIHFSVRIFKLSLIRHPQLTSRGVHRAAIVFWQIRKKISALRRDGTFMMCSLYSGVYSSRHPSYQPSQVAERACQAVGT